MQAPNLNELTGADKANCNRKVVLATFSLFCLLSSYYFIKPLRKGFYFSEFSAELLPYFHLGVILLILATTAIIVRIFKSTKSHKFARNFLIVVTLVNSGLGIILLTPNKFNVACFCLWSSTYFPLSMALFWGGLNQNFDSQSSKSFYAVIWIGAILGGLCGSYFSNIIIEDFHWSYQFLLSTIFMILAILSFERLHRVSANMSHESKSNEFTYLRAGNLFKMILDLFKNPYLACLAVIILSLTFSRGVFDLQSDTVVEREISIKLYRDHFWGINQQITHNKESGQMSPLFFNFIFSYKNLNNKQRNESFYALTDELNITLVKDKFDFEYEKYRRAIKREVALFNSKIWTYQNIISLGILLICKLNIVTKIGITPLIMCLPITYVLVFLLMFTSVSLMEIFILKVITLALDYSVHNTAKEIMYVPLGENVNIGYKPIIEGPLFKLGAASSSVFKIILDTTMNLLSMTNLIAYVFVATAGIVAINWTFTAKALGQRFYLLRS